MQSKNAIGSLKNRYLSVLKKCNLLNTFGSLAVVGALTASLSLAVNALILEKAEAFALPMSDYLTVEEVQAGTSYYSTFTLLENDISKNYGLLFRNGLNSPALFDTPESLANAMVLESNPNYKIASGFGGLHDFTLNIAGQSLEYTVTDPTISLARIGALTTDVSDGVFYGLTSANRGGAIEVSATHNLKINASFVGNTAADSGGAISLWGVDNSNVSGTFIANHVDNHGGAITVYLGNDNSLSGVFIGNTSNTNGGAISNLGNTQSIAGAFVGNSADKWGGAIFNNGDTSIATISGTFIANQSVGVKDESTDPPYYPGGGAIFNAELGSIGSINANFVGNTSNYAGGAIANRGTISALNGVFIENTASENGGALYNFAATNIAMATISDIDASFISNKTTAPNGAGGAIWTNRDLDFLANNRINVFSGNMDSSGYNAIYVEDSRHDVFVNLNFSMLGNGGFIMNDSIRSNSMLFYDVNINGQNNNNFFALNNTISGVRHLTVNGAGLSLGTVDYNGTDYSSTIHLASATFGANTIFSVNTSLYTSATVFQGYSYEYAIEEPAPTPTDPDATTLVPMTFFPKLTVEANAKLQLVNPQLGQTIVVTNNFTSTDSNIAQGAWEGDNLISSFSLYKGDVVNSDPNSYTVKLAPKSVEELKAIYNDMDIATAHYLQNFTTDYDNPLSGRGFFTTLFDNENGLGENNPALVTKTSESLLQFSVAANTSANSFNISNISAETIQKNRTNLVNSQSSNVAYLEDIRDENSSLSAGSESFAIRNGLAVWATPFYSNTNASGFESGSFDNGYESSLGGLSFGVDYTSQNEYRFGLAINGGGGSSESDGDFNQTTNDFNFVGLSLYGARPWNGFDLSADMGYTFVYNDVEQSLASVLGAPQAKANIHSHVFTLGTQAAYPFEWQSFDVTPFIGLRYTNILTSSHDVKISGSTVVHGDFDSQNIFSIPMGISLSKEYSTANAWNIKPRLDLGVTCSFGELEASPTSSIPNVVGSSSYHVENVDTITFNGGLGLELAKNNISFGLNYDLQTSKHETSHGVQAMFQYKF